jgi:bifunctional oligoribonuclease and PAP phosphatase NrnA
MKDFDAAVELIGKGKRFLVTAHASPDGDALGSMLATAHGLRALGKEAVLYNRDAAPARFRFLPGAPELRSKLPKGDRFDACLVHDAGDARLLGEGFPPRDVTGPLIVLDHHATVKPFGDLELRDAGASAVGVIVARLLRALGVSLDKNIADCLWCSLVCDTGWFRYPSVDAETLELARACVAAGAVPWEFASRVEEEQPAARLRLLALVLQTLEIRGRLALLHLDDELLNKAGAAPEMAENFANHARALEGVEVGVLLTRTRRGWNASLRGKGGVDVGAVAAKFDGGGHRGAAGCTIPVAAGEDAAAARQKLIAALEEALGQKAP